MSKLIDSITALPRSAKWVIATAVVCVLYFFVIEKVLDRTNSYASRADMIEKSIGRVSDITSESSGDGATIQSAARSFGKPRMPTDAATGAQVIQRIVDEVLANNKVEDSNKNEKSSSLSGDYLDALKPGDGSIRRFIVDVSFDATQETVAHVIADLERSPAVSAVSRIKIDRSGLYSAPTRDPAGNDNTGPRLVRASISAESWAFVPGDSSGGDQ